MMSLFCSRGVEIFKFKSLNFVERKVCGKIQYSVKSEKNWVRKLGKQCRKLGVKNGYSRQDFKITTKS
jgi:hypothetical protein